MNVKTAVIINDFNYVQGGASKVAIDTAKILIDSGIKVYFFCGVSKEQEKIDGVEYICTNQQEAMKEKNKIKGAVNGIYNLMAKRKLKELLKKLDKETTIVHVHGWTKALSSSIFYVLHSMKYKTVITIHDYFLSCPNGGYFNYKKEKVCEFRPMSTKCLCCNCDSRNYLWKIYRSIRQIIQNKIIKRINANAIYISEFSKEKLNNKHVIKWGNTIINNPAGFEKTKFEIRNSNKFVFVGRLSKEKGIELFCKAIENTNSMGIVVGDGPLKEELEKRYKTIEFVGWKNKDEIKTILLNSKALIFTSLWYETMGMTAIEALSLGIPVIAGDNCCTSKYIKNNENGLIYKMGNLKDLSEKIDVLKDEMVLKNMKVNAYNNYWLNPFSDEKYINGLLEYYKKI